MASQNSTPDGSNAPQRSPRHVHLDGRTLEGGGQLVRNALALSALTGRPVTIDNVRGNRQAKRGLKASHAAAIKLLAEISGSKVSDGRVGAQSVTFEPQPPVDETAFPDPGSTVPDSLLVPLSNLTIQSEYDIRLATPGSVFLIFQALYPYLLHVGSQAAADCIKLTITGGTNGSFSPSYDFASQVMSPNFAKLGLPPLSITLHKRGWSSGPVGMGSVTFLVHPLRTPGHRKKPSDGRALTMDEDPPTPSIATERFPYIDIMDYERGKITNIDITVLATDSTVSGEKLPVRKYVERTTRKALRQALANLDPSIFDPLPASDLETPRSLDSTSDGRTPVPIRIHASEPTSHFARLYLLIVAHTSTGFKIGHDTLLENMKSHRPGKKKHKNVKKNRQRHAQDGSQPQSELSRVTELIEECIEGFVAELSEESAGHTNHPPDAMAGKKSFLDAHMRDQIVVFEALGRLGRVHAGPRTQEDERFWTLHTQTAQWVCQEMLGPRKEG